MRLLAIAAVAFALVSPAAARNAPPMPTDVYADFASHGRLTKEYPRALLQSIIGDASLNQYGDPLVMLRLRRAARLQLAGVFPAAATTATATVAPTTVTASTTQSATAPGTTARPVTTPRTTVRQTTTPTTRTPVNTTSAAPLLSTRAILLIALAFALAVGALAVASIRARRR